jgi:O-methyltransferase
MSFQTQLYTIVGKIFNRSHIDLIHFKRSWRKEIFQQITKIKQERSFLLTYLDAYNIASLTKSTNKLSGDIAEIGSFKGASAKLISQNKNNERHFFVIDSFEGLPEVKDIDKESGFYKGEYLSDFDDVKNYLNEFPNTTVLKGFFPEKNAELLENRMFSFVHLDIDLYEPTKICLEFFYPRMVVGGVIISHDFQTPGIQRAFDEFLADKPEISIEMMERQGIIVKI